MGWLVAIIVGAVVGWLAAPIIRNQDYTGTTTDVAIGVLGAVIGRWFFMQVLRIGAAAGPTALILWIILWGVVGAVIFLGALRAVRSRR